MFDDKNQTSTGTRQDHEDVLENTNTFNDIVDKNSDDRAEQNIKHVLNLDVLLESKPEH